MASIIKVNPIQDATNSNTAMSVDTAGRVNFPTLPRVSVTHSTNGTVTYSADDHYVTDSTIQHRITMVGITFGGSNGRFTVPVSGDYALSYFNMINGVASGTGVVEWNIKKNGSDILLRAYQAADSSYWSNMGCSGIVSLSASDYITIECGAASASYDGHGGNYSGFSMHLLG